MNIRLLIIFCLGMAAADIITTYTAVDLAGTTSVELNPFARASMETIGLISGQLIQKTLALSAIIYLGYLIVPSDRKMGIALALLVLASMQLFASVNNVHQIQKFLAHDERYHIQQKP